MNRKLFFSAFFGPLLLSSYALVAFQGGAGSTGDCDPGLKLPEGNPPNAYLQRKDRCEGIYAREIAGTSLGLASFTRQFDPFDPKLSDTLRLDWSAPARNIVHLRAVSLKPRFFYRMDALRRDGTNSWQWPMDILRDLKIEKANLGIIATTTMSVGGIERELYLPLRISTNDGSQSSRYELLLRSDVELSEVFISIGELDKQGKIAKYLRRDEALQYGVYPPERGIPVYISAADLHANSFYEVDVGARLRTGGSANARFWIYSGN